MAIEIDAGSVEIESSTDTVEEVQEALGSAIEIEESPSADEGEAPEEKETTPAATEETEEETPEAGETTTEEETEQTEEEEEAEEKKEAKPKAADTIPRSRLNKEIARRKELERQLREKSASSTEKETAPTETEPQSFSGKPEPKIEDFVSNDKYPDPYATFTKEHGKWVREETMAEIAQQQEQQAAENERKALVANFTKAMKDTVKRLADYNDVIEENADVQISGPMQLRIYKSAIGPDLLYHLAKNPDEAAEIFDMDSDDQIAAMVELETRIKGEIKASHKATAGESETSESTPPKKTVPPKKVVSKAPVPPSRLKPAGPGPKSLEELAGPTDRVGVDLEFNPEYERAWKAQRKT